MRFELECKERVSFVTCNYKGRCVWRVCMSVEKYSLISQVTLIWIQKIIGRVWRYQNYEKHLDDQRIVFFEDEFYDLLEGNVLWEKVVFKDMSEITFKPSIWMAFCVTRGEKKNLKNSYFSYNSSEFIQLIKALWQVTMRQ